MTTPLSSTEAYEYVFSTASIYSERIGNGLYLSCLRLGTSVFNALTALVVIVAYLLILVVKLAVMIFPHFISTVRIIIQFHQTKLTRTDIIVEFSVISLFVLFLLLRKPIAHRWRIFEQSVAKKSKAAAEAAPHIAFFSFSLIVSIAGRKFLVHLTSSSVLPVVSLVIPLVTTLMDFRQLGRNSGKSSERSVMLKRKLTLWVVLAAYHTVATGLGLIPFSARIASALPLAREVIVVVIIWTQISHKFGDIVFNAAIPFLKYLSRNIPSANFGASSGSSVISMLRMMRVINAKYEKFFRSLQQDIVIVLISLVFIFSPWRIAYVGVIIVSLLFPAFKSSNVLLLRELGREGDSEFWLQYWVCWAAMWLSKCYGFRMWPSMMLLSAMWLQHSLFRGACVVFSFFGSNLTAVMDRHDRIQCEKDADALTPLKLTAAEESLQTPSPAPKRRLRSTPTPLPAVTATAVTGTEISAPNSTKKDRPSSDEAATDRTDDSSSKARKNK